MAPSADEMIIEGRMNNDMESLIREIYAKVKEIDANLKHDYHALYGNGSPGLVKDVANLKQDLAVIKARQSWWGSAIAGWISVIAWLITTTVSILAIIKR